MFIPKSMLTSNLPDFSTYGYQITQKLGHNRAGGRVTYKALDQNNQPVAIKQFQFNVEGADWADFKAHEREIEVLRSLNHPGIPKYLDSFQTASGFCLVQEYKAGQNLACGRSYSREQSKQIANSVLDILVYLQNQNPPVFHRDIKPENILVSETLEVYLVDFGFARIGSRQMTASSVVAGTYGFMPPEQILNRQLTKASDLYGLGATLVCLLAGIESFELVDYVDETFTIDIHRLLPDLDPSFKHWLQKLVAPRLRDRFIDAATARAALGLEIVAAKSVTPERSKSSNKLQILLSNSRTVLILSFPFVVGVGAGVSCLWPYYQLPGAVPNAIVDKANQETAVAMLATVVVEGLVFLIVRRE